MTKAERAERKEEEKTKVEKPRLRLVKEVPAPVELAKPAPIDFGEKKKKQESKDKAKAEEVRAKIKGKRTKRVVNAPAFNPDDVAELSAHPRKRTDVLPNETIDKKLEEAREVIKKVNEEREAESSKKAKRAADVKALAERDMELAEPAHVHGPKRTMMDKDAVAKAVRKHEAKAEQKRKAELTVIESRDEEQETSAAAELDITVPELRTIEHRFAEIQAELEKSGDEKLPFTWEDFLSASGPEKPKGFGARVASLFRKPTSKRLAMWKKMMDAMNQVSAGQTKVGKRRGTDRT
jgi:hypothetical protein